MLLDKPLPSKNDVETVAQSMVALVNIFYDLVSQDLPPALEDAHAEFVGAENGIFVRLLMWDPTELQPDTDDTIASVPMQVKTAIFEVGEIHAHRYPELLSGSRSVEAFVRTLWALLSGGQCLGIAFNNLVSQAMRFISSAIRSGYFKATFQSKDTISTLVEGVVVSDVTLRTHGVEREKKNVDQGFL